MWCVDIATVFACLLGARFMGGIFRGTCRAAAAAAADAWVVERVGGDMIQCHTHTYEITLSSLFLNNGMQWPSLGE